MHLAIRNAVLLQGSVVPARLDVRLTDHGSLAQRRNRVLGRTSFDDMVILSFV